MRRVPEKGLPDFSMFSAKEIVDMRLCLNKLMGCYSFSSEKKKILEEMWKELAFASVDAVASLPDKKVSEDVKPVVKLKTDLFKRNLLKKKLKGT